MVLQAEPRRRLILRRTSAYMAVIAGVAFAVVYLWGLLSPPGQRSGDVIDFGGLAPGTAELAGWHGRAVWIVRRSPEMLAGLAAVTPHVLPPATDNSTDDPVTRSLLPEYGVYLAATDRTGVIVQFVSDRPRALAADLPWYGGFYDPATARCYDAAGRVYAATADAGATALRIPPHRYIAREMISLGGG